MVACPRSRVGGLLDVPPRLCTDGRRVSGLLLAPPLCCAADEEGSAPAFGQEGGGEGEHPVNKLASAAMEKGEALLNKAKVRPRAAGEGRRACGGWAGWC